MSKRQNQAESSEIEQRPSKSQLKREMAELQKVGQKLVELPPAKLDLFQLDDDLLEAIKTAQRINSREGRRRQLQYIGKLMRKVDTCAIQHSLEQMSIQHQKETDDFHEIESWRGRLVKEGDIALNDLIDKYSHLNRQHMRQLIRSAQKEAQQGKPPASSRALHRYLRENIDCDD